MIRAIIETSLVDWDGKLTMVVFFDRCNFLCPFCQNWELILHPERFPKIHWTEVMAKLKKKKKWIDGIVFTGGEPFVYFRKLSEYARQLKAAGFGVKVDTNGGFPRELETLIKTGHVDYLAMDIKAPLDGSYLAAIGKERSEKNIMLVKKVKESISIIVNSGVGYEFRTTCVPGIIDADAIRMIGAQIRGAKRWFLQGFIPDHAYKQEYRNSRFSPAEMHGLLEAARGYVKTAAIRGVADQKT
jgi:pyruvate formate lyase activating enzyme